jgi:hypothetical protein
MTERSDEEKEQRMYQETIQQFLLATRCYLFDSQPAHTCQISATR